MLTELRPKAQITIPKKIVLEAGLAEGDQLDITAHDGVIYITPVAVYPKVYVQELRNEISELKSRLKTGTQKAFTNVDDMLAELEA